MLPKLLPRTLMFRGTGNFTFTRRFFGLPTPSNKPAQALPRLEAMPRSSPLILRLAAQFSSSSFETPSVSSQHPLSSFHSLPSSPTSSAPALRRVAQTPEIKSALQELQFQERRYVNPSTVLRRSRGLSLQRGSALACAAAARAMAGCSKNSPPVAGRIINPRALASRPVGSRTFLTGPGGQQLIRLLVQLALRHLPRLGAPFLIFILARIVPILASVLLIGWLYLLFTALPATHAIAYISFTVTVVAALFAVANAIVSFDNSIEEQVLGRVSERAGAEVQRGSARSFVPVWDGTEPLILKPRRIRRSLGGVDHAVIHYAWSAAVTGDNTILPGMPLKGEVRADVSVSATGETKVLNVLFVYRSETGDVTGEVAV